MAEGLGWDCVSFCSALGQASRGQPRDVSQPDPTRTAPTKCRGESGIVWRRPRMANLLQGCNSLGAVNSELSHSENTSGGGGRASIRNAYLLVLFVLSARRSGIAIGRDEHFLSIFRGGESTVKPYPQRLFMFVLSCTQHRYYTGLTPSGRRSCRKAYGFMDSQKKKPHSSEPTSSRSAVTTRVGFDWFLSGIAAEHWLDPVGA